MIQAIRRHVNATTVIAVFALIFAMSGGAYAAKRFLITSKSQISPKVLKSLKGARGAKGANGVAGAQGPAGPAGPAGPVGPAGAPGAAGPKGEDGKDGSEGKEGKQGAPGTTGFTETLPSGKTETGTWSATQETEEVGTVAAISFTIPLAEGLEESQVHVDSLAEPNFEEVCPGSAEAPKATKGNLCVYTGVSKGLEVLRVIKPFTAAEAGTGPNGAIIRMAQPSTAEPTLAYGSWAVTAP
jgi:hypothetical protein